MKFALLLLAGLSWAERIETDAKLTIDSQRGVSFEAEAKGSILDTLNGRPRVAPPGQGTVIQQPQQSPSWLTNSDEFFKKKEDE